MKKYILLTALILSLGLSGIAQNELGFNVFPQMTQMNNKANRTGDPIYRALPTVSYGLGVNWTRQIGARTSGSGSIRNGILASSLKTKKSINIGLVYSAHDQKWESEFRKDGVLTQWEGSKRFDYLKIPVVAKFTRPLNHLFNVTFYGGPQLSILMKAEGGIIHWKHYDTYDYFDLPFSDRKYFNALTLDAVAGVDFEYKLTRWVYLTFGLRADLSMTTVENNDRIVNNYPTYGDVRGYDKERGNGHNSSVAFLLGFNYQLHKARYDRTRF